MDFLVRRPVLNLNAIGLGSIKLLCVHRRFTRGSQTLALFLLSKD